MCVGIAWTPAAGGRAVIAKADSPTSVAWDPRRGKYVAHTRLDAKDPGASGCFGRWVLISESADFEHWSPTAQLRFDAQDKVWSRAIYDLEFMLLPEVSGPQVAFP